MIDRTTKRDRRDQRRRKRRPVHGRSLEHILRAQANRLARIRANGAA